MINIRRHNPVLQQRLSAYVAAGDAEGLRDYLTGLSHALFRTASYLLGESMLAQLAPADFWRFFGTIVPADTKAYLGTFLKPAATQCVAGGIGSGMTVLENFAATATPIDCRKLLDALLPRLSDTDAMERLLRLFGSGDPHAEADILLRVGTQRAYFLLLRRLRTMEAEPLRLRACCLQLMRKGDHLSFNMACVVQAYFGLKDLPGTFSLRVEPYELSRLDGSYEDFCKIIRK